MKQSGVGRELGPHALDYYTEVKNVYISTESEEHSSEPWAQGADDADLSAEEG
jgi:hypothetical protein